MIATASTLALNSLHVQLPDRANVAPLLDRLVAEAIPNQHGLAAWRALIHAHATLMRKLATDLVERYRAHAGRLLRGAAQGERYLRDLRNRVLQLLADPLEAAKAAGVVRAN